jgi:hypothetical protein
MQLFRFVIVIAATLVVVGRYLQELHRLAAIKRMPGEKARAYFESTRERSERVLTVLTVALAALAVGGAVYSFLWKA